VGPPCEREPQPPIDEGNVQPTNHTRHTDPHRLPGRAPAVPTSSPPGRAGKGWWHG
jgi:hypothetical protein